MTRVPREAGARRDRHRRGERGRLRPRAARAGSDPRRARGLDRARDLPAARRAGALRHPPRGLLDGHRHARALPAGELGHPRAAAVETEVGARVDDGGHRGRRDAEVDSAADLEPPVLVDSARGSAAARASAPGPWSGPAARSRGRPCRRLRPSCAVAGSGRRQVVGRDPRRRRQGRRRRRRRADGSIVGEGARIEPGAVSSATRGSSPGSGGMSAVERRASTAIREVDSQGQLDDVLGAAGPPAATRSSGSSRPGSSRSSASGLVVCGMGGSGDRRRLARGRARATGCHCRSPPSGTTGSRRGRSPERIGPLRELLGQHRGDARVLRGGRGGSAARGSSRRRGRARRRGAGRGRAGDRPSGGAPAPRSGRLHVRRRRRGRRAGRRGARDPDRDRRCAAAPPRPRDALVERPTDIADALAGTIPVIYGADLTRAGRLSLEDADQREREAPRVPHELPEMDHNEIVGWDAGAARSGSPRCSCDDPDQHPAARQRLELTAELIEPAAPASSWSSRGGDTDSPDALDAMLGDLSRSPRGAARGGPDAGRGDREAEGTARAPVTDRRVSIVRRDGPAPRRPRSVRATASAAPARRSSRSRATAPAPRSTSLPSPGCRTRPRRRLCSRRGT